MFDFQEGRGDKGKPKIITYVIRIGILLCENVMKTQLKTYFRVSPDQHALQHATTDR